MKKLVWAVVVVIVVGGGYFALQRDEVEEPKESASPEVSVVASPEVTAMQSPGADSMKGPVKTFEVSGGMFYFDPKEMKVNKGDTVKIIFTNKEGFHDWVIDEFNARTPQIKAGETSTIEFVADKTGTFQYYCSVGAHRAQGMWGNLIVQ